ncbi:MAG: signal peptidase I [Gemmatimonadetes bacterium]|nr:signal peptidase I [Gemmatimonadota bacterium]
MVTDPTPEVPLVTPQRERRRRHPAALFVRAMYEWTKSLSLALLLFVFVRAFFVEAFKIPSGSMEGTLLVGDFLLVNKLVYGAEVPITGQRLPAVRKPAYRDVLVFQWPEDPTKNFVKLLVGLPGDTLAMNDGVLVRNGQPQVEPYVTHSEPGSDPIAEEFRWQRNFLVRYAAAAPSYHPSRNNWGPIVVPAHDYFVLGDNRDNSLDSRYWGFVADTLVRGSPLFVYYSFDPDSAVAFDWLRRIRWRRLGERIH